MTDTALITGASSGIGSEFARILAKNRHDLVLVARSTQKLEMLKEEIIEKYPLTKITIYTCDLSDFTQRQMLLMNILKQNQRIDVLINNAGVGYYGKFLESDYKQQIEMLEVNIRAIMDLTKTIAGIMSKQNYGKILNVSSTAAFQPIGNFSVYTATKSFIYSFSLGLREELKSQGVSVCTLCPGPTKTNFQIKGNLTRSKFFELASMDSHQVALIGLRGLMNDKAVIIPGIRNKLSSLGMKLLPSVLSTRLATKILSQE